MNKVPVIDLFSGAGGMSFGFHANPYFSIIGAVDAELGKPSSKSTSLECNKTYLKNIGLNPIKLNLVSVTPNDLANLFAITNRFEGVLSACPPCTDFTRAKPINHSFDGARNILTSNLAKILLRFNPKYFVYENAREALEGSHKHHLEDVIQALNNMNYSYKVETVEFSDFGLPQRRERVILIASRGNEIKYFNDLWNGYSFERNSNTVRQCLKRIVELEKSTSIVTDKRYPTFTPPVLERMKAIPQNGGSWTDIAESHLNLLIPSMQKKIMNGNLGSYPDVYGRMHFDKPAPTIKRECGHVGNGRYAHPVENRLLNISEMSMLQGFPLGYDFDATSLANCYRQIGDAVPPFISFQIASIVKWIDSGIRPTPNEFVLPKSVLESKKVLYSELNLKAS